MRHSLRLKITAITIGAVLTAILCVFLASLATVQAEADRRSVETLNLMADDTCKSLEKYTEGIEQSVEMMAHIANDTLDSSELVDGGVVTKGDASPARSAKQEAELDAYLKGYVKSLQAACATVASQTPGIVTYYFCVSPEVSAEEHGFFYSRVGKAGFDEQEPLDARLFDPNDMEHYTWYYTPLTRGRPSWIGPYTAHFLGEILP